MYEPDTTPAGEIPGNTGDTPISPVPEQEFTPEVSPSDIQSSDVQPTLQSLPVAASPVIQSVDAVATDTSETGSGGTVQQDMPSGDQVPLQSPTQASGEPVTELQSSAPQTIVIPEVQPASIPEQHMIQPIVTPESGSDVTPEQPAEDVTKTDPVTKQAPGATKPGFAGITKGKTVTIAGVTFDQAYLFWGLLAGGAVLILIVGMVLFGMLTGSTRQQAEQGAGGIYAAPTEPQMIVRQKNPRTGTYASIVDPMNLSSPVELQFDTRRFLPKSTPDYRIEKYEWDLNGDGRYTEAEGDGPVATFLYRDAGTNGGLFEVSLRVTKEILVPHGPYAKIGEVVTEVYGPGKETGGYTFKITSERPLIDVRTNPTELDGVVPFTVEFDASRSFAKDGIAEISWDFDGDGIGDQVGERVSYQYTKEGTYTVTVIVEDTNGVSSEQKLEVFVDEARLPLAQIVADVEAGDAPVKVNFDASTSTSPDGQIVEYAWDFGDGTPVQKGKTLSYTFTKTGRYTVSLTVKTDLGTTNTAQKVISVSTSKGAPVARIRANGEGGDLAKSSATQDGILRGKIPLKVAFDATPSSDPENDIVSWKWNVNGDNTFDANGSTIDFTYKTPGSYLVTLQVEDSSGTTSEARLTVIAEADDFVASVVADPLSSVAPKTIAFDASGSYYSRGQIASYEWDFGDGSPKRLSGAIQSHEYTSPGVYTVTVRVRATDGTVKQANVIVTLLQQDLIPVLRVTPQTGQAPLQLDFDGSESVGDILSYRWDFGNGGTGTGSRISYTYTAAGTYTVTLTIQDRAGNVQRTTRQIQVK